MNDEINRLAQGFAGEHGLHATDVQAPAAILDADGPMTPGLLRTHLGLISGAGAFPASKGSTAVATK